MDIMRYSRLTITAGSLFAAGLLIGRHAPAATVAIYALPVAIGLTMFFAGLITGWHAGHTSIVAYRERDIYRDRLVYTGDVLPAVDAQRPALPHNGGR